MIIVIIIKIIMIIIRIIIMKIIRIMITIIIIKIMIKKAIIILFCLSVCLFVSNKRQNGWTDRFHFLCDLAWPQIGKVYEWSKFQIFVSIKIRSPLNFLKFWKSTKFLWKSANDLCFVLRCTRKEHVHN